ncbi:MAG: von Willebrand factor type A domain-containing protein, partial [Magnetospirillum sp.]
EVDTASYAVMRRLLSQTGKVPAQAVRVEEMINYFPYDYAGPEQRQDGFATHATIVPSPWKKGAKLLHLGIKAWAPTTGTRPPANLTFLVDVSGSMMGADRLPLVQASLRQLVEALRPDDKVALVTYASGTAIRLEPTAAGERAKILAAIDGLRAGGGTAGAAGLNAAYAQAQAMFEDKAANRVILATDGDFNLGASSPKALEELITEKRKTGIYLTVLGVGLGNLNDTTMQSLAQAGNGQAAYLDSLLEARKVLVNQLESSVIPVADDVKIQVEFNPAKVAEYRLIGYETRALRRADFNNDKVDAGEIGAGHSVTALYEFLPVGVSGKAMDDLRYAPKKKAETATGQVNDEYAFVKLRHKVPGQSESRLSTLAVSPSQDLPNLDSASDDVRFAVAIAGFGQILRGQLDKDMWGPTIALAQGAKGADPYGWRGGAVDLMELAKSMP